MADKTGYIGRNPGDSSVTIARQTFTPTSDTTEFTFTAGYTVGLCDVYLNGAKLIDATDYDANTGTTVGLTSCYTSAASTKTILIGGTFANNTNNEVNVTVSVYDNSATSEVAIASKIPVPNGSSFVISDTGKTVLESLDAIRVYCDTANAIDVTLSILTGVS